MPDCSFVGCFAHAKYPRVVALLIAPALGMAKALAAEAEGAKPPAAGDGSLALSLPVLFAASLVIAFVVVAGILKNALSGSNWTIADALSEEANVTLRDESGKPVLDASGKPNVTSELRASSSRFIAIFGLFAILILYFGAGVVLVKRLAGNEALLTKDDFSELQGFLVSGAALFAPYAFNQLSSIFDWLKPPPKP